MTRACIFSKGMNFVPLSVKRLRLVSKRGSARDVQQARVIRTTPPIKAAISAQSAVAVAILTFTSVRLCNLINIELGLSLIKHFDRVGFPQHSAGEISPEVAVMA